MVFDRDTLGKCDPWLMEVENQGGGAPQSSVFPTHALKCGLAYLHT